MREMPAEENAEESFKASFSIILPKAYCSNVNHSLLRAISAFNACEELDRNWGSFPDPQHGGDTKYALCSSCTCMVVWL